MGTINNVGAKFSKLMVLTAIGQLFKDLANDRENTVCTVINIVKDADIDKYDSTIKSAGEYLYDRYNVENANIILDDSVVHIILGSDDPTRVSSLILDDINGFIDNMSQLMIHDIPQFSFDIVDTDDSVIITLPVESEKVLSCLEESNILPLEIDCK